MANPSLAEEADQCAPAAAPPLESSRLTLSQLAKVDRGNLYWFVYRRVRDATEAEEITQETFAEATRSLSRFSGNSTLRTWLYGIAINLISSHMRRSPSRRFRFESDETLEQLTQDGADPLQQLMAPQLLGRVLEHVESLPHAMRETLVMVFLSEVSYEDTAAALNVPIGTIRSRISRARSLLRARLQADGIPMADGPTAAELS